MAKQLEFKRVGGWGGKRRGAGRPNRSGLVSHGKREVVKLKYPMHINWHLRKGVALLRNWTMLREFRKAVSQAERQGLHVIHFSLQHNHIHIIVESTSNERLARGMRSLGCKFGKVIRKATGKTGKVFEGRYHLHVLKTPTETRNALKYVLLNYSRHTKLIEHIDGFSSGYAFKEWRRLVGFKPMIESTLEELGGKKVHILSPPRSWLLKEGWKKAAG